MRNMTWEAMARVCNGSLHNVDGAGGCDKEVEGVALDSRKVRPGYLFIATVGERADGHSFIPEVMERGAAGVVCERPPERPAGPYLLVKDSFQALRSLAEYYRQQLSVKVIGVTGSVGKTSTKEMIASVLGVRFQVLKTEGNYNNEVGLPLTVLQIRGEHQAAVLEMGISHFGEMHRLSKIARPDICVLTNIGQCHLEFLGSREGILKAKSEIFDYMSGDGTVCLNGDDALLRTLQNIKGHTPLRFGLSADNDCYADQVRERGLFGSEAVIHKQGQVYPVRIPLPGGHMVYNALAAACVGGLLGLTAEEIVRGIESIQPVSGRSNILRLPGRVVIDDCYNANPVSMKAALDLLSRADTRRVAILGDMYELGENTDALHADVGRYAADREIERILCVGELSRFLYEAALERTGNKERVSYYPDRERLMQDLSGQLREGDTVLVKASHGMGFGQVVDFLSAGVITN